MSQKDETRSWPQSAGTFVLEIDRMRRRWMVGRGENLAPDFSVIGYHRLEKVRGTGKPRTSCTVHHARRAEYRMHFEDASDDTEMLSMMLEH